jgi:arylsulfatase A-like enzyme
VAATADATPETMITSPAAGQVVPPGTLTASGRATDDRGVSAVQVAVRDSQGRWLRTDGTWTTTTTWLSGAALTAPGATATDWSRAVTLSAGAYSIGARARDNASRLDPTPAWVAFTVRQPTPPPTSPNIVLILTDDQRFDTMDAMPATTRLIGDAGVRFRNAFVVNPLCCPSRATIAKGAYSHTTHVYQNGGPQGPMEAYDDTSTLATWLDGAGYATALMGKYFNGYDEARVSYVPPGWDRWVAFATSDVGGGRYYDYELSIDGVPEEHAQLPEDYSTDVLAARATSFIRGTDAETPLFLWFSPYGPHEPATAAPRHIGSHAGIPVWRPPSWNEADVSDKPAYIRAQPTLTSAVRDRVDNLRRKQLDTLMSVDEAVEDIVSALDETGRLDNTLLMFLSDNGFHWGEHRWGQTGPNQKNVPYEESIRTPLMVRYDPITAAAPGRTEDRLALAIDLAPTAAELAGVPAPGVEGRSLVPLLQGTTGSWRQDFLVEHSTTSPVPAYCAVRTTSELYAAYTTGEQEYYDLSTDPGELTNRVSDPTVAARVAVLRTRAQQLCSPVPPSFTWTPQ